MQPHRTGESYVPRFSEAHQFYWFSDMTRDEAILLKIYDSDSHEGLARGSLHTSFRNPAAATDPPRESMEVRCIVLFGPEELTSQVCLREDAMATNVGMVGGEEKMGPAGGGHKVAGLVDRKSTPAE